MSWFGTLVNKHSLAATALVTSLIVTGLLPAAPAGATDGQPSPSDEASSAVESAQSGETTSADLGVAIDTLNKSVLPAVTGAQDTAPAEGANEAVDSTQSWCPSLAWEANPLGFTGQGEYAGNQVEVYAAGDAQFDTDPGDVAVFVKGDLTVGDDETYLDSVDPSDAPYVTFDSELGALNAALEALEKQPSGKVSLDGETFTLTGDGQSPVQVFNISAEQAPALANADTVLNLTSIPGEVGDLQSTVILNVEGSDVTTVHQNLQLNINGLNVDADEDQDKWANLTQHLMWRFPQADAVVIGDQTDMDDEADYNFAGTIFAAKEGTDLTVNTPTSGRLLSNGDLDVTAAIPDADLATLPLILPDVSACEADTAVSEEAAENLPTPAAGNTPAPLGVGGSNSTIDMGLYYDADRGSMAGAKGPIDYEIGFYGKYGFVTQDGRPSMGKQCSNVTNGAVVSPKGPNASTHCNIWMQRPPSNQTWTLDWNHNTETEAFLYPFENFETSQWQMEGGIYSWGFRQLDCVRDGKSLPGYPQVNETLTNGKRYSQFNGYPGVVNNDGPGITEATEISIHPGENVTCRYYNDKLGDVLVKKQVKDINGNVLSQGNNRSFGVTAKIYDRDNGPLLDEFTENIWQGRDWAGPARQWPGGSRVEFEETDRPEIEGLEWVRTEYSSSDGQTGETMEIPRATSPSSGKTHLYVTVTNVYKPKPANPAKITLRKTVNGIDYKEGGKDGHFNVDWKLGVTEVNGFTNGNASLTPPAQGQTSWQYTGLGVQGSNADRYAEWNVGFADASRTATVNVAEERNPDYKFQKLTCTKNGKPFFIQTLNNFGGGVNDGPYQNVGSQNFQVEPGDDIECVFENEPKLDTFQVNKIIDGPSECVNSKTSFNFRVRVNLPYMPEGWSVNNPFEFSFQVKPNDTWNSKAHALGELPYGTRVTIEEMEAWELPDGCTFVGAEYKGKSFILGENYSNVDGYGTVTDRQGLNPLFQVTNKFSKNKPTTATISVQKMVLPYGQKYYESKQGWGLKANVTTGGVTQSPNGSSFHDSGKDGYVTWDVDLKSNGSATVQISEESRTNYKLDDLRCTVLRNGKYVDLPNTGKNVAQQYQDNGGYIPIQFEGGDQVDCTFYNDELPPPTADIYIAKNIGNKYQDGWSVGVNQVSGFGPASLSGTNPQTTVGSQGWNTTHWTVNFNGASSASVSVYEQMKQDYEFDSLYCRNMSGEYKTFTDYSGTISKAFEVKPGEEWACEFSNKKIEAGKGQIRVVKEVCENDNPNNCSAANWNATVEQTAGTLDVSDSGSQKATGTQGATWETSGTPGTTATVKLWEGSGTVPGTTFQSLSCNGGSLSNASNPTSYGNAAVLSDVKASDSITCTFKNTKQKATGGSITIVKKLCDFEGKNCDLNASGTKINVKKNGGGDLTISTPQDKTTPNATWSTSGVVGASADLQIWETAGGNTYQELTCTGGGTLTKNTPTSSANPATLKGVKTGDNILCTFENWAPKAITPGSAAINITKYVCVDGSCGEDDLTVADAKVTVKGLQKATVKEAATQNTKDESGATWSVTLADQEVPGSFQLSEVFPASDHETYTLWQFHELKCSVNGGAVKSYNQNQSIPISSGDSVKCRFVNKAVPRATKATIEVKKFTCETASTCLGDGAKDWTLGYKAGAGVTNNPWGESNWKNPMPTTGGQAKWDVGFGNGSKGNVQFYEDPTAAQANDYKFLKMQCRYSTKGSTQIYGPWFPVSYTGTGMPSSSSPTANVEARGGQLLQCQMFNVKQTDTTPPPATKDSTVTVYKEDHTDPESIKKLSWTVGMSVDSGSGSVAVASGSSTNTNGATGSKWDLKSVPENTNVVLKMWEEDKTSDWNFKNLECSGAASVVLPANGTTPTQSNPAKVTVRAGDNVKCYFHNTQKSTSPTPGSGDAYLKKYVDSCTGSACTENSSKLVSWNVKMESTSSNLTITNNQQQATGTGGGAHWTFNFTDKTLPGLVKVTELGRATSDGKQYEVESFYCRVGGKQTNYTLGENIPVSAGDTLDCYLFNKEKQAASKTTLTYETTWVVKGGKYDGTWTNEQLLAKDGWPQNVIAPRWSLKNNVSWEFWPTNSGIGTWGTTKEIDPSTGQVRLSSQVKANNSALDALPQGCSWDKQASGHAHQTKRVTPSPDQSVEWYSPEASGTRQTVDITQGENKFVLVNYVTCEDPEPDKINITVNKEWVITGDHKTYTAGTHKHGSAVGQLLGGNGRVGFGDDSSQDYSWGSTVQGISGSKVKVGERVSIPADCEWNPQSDGKATYVKSVQDNNGVYINGSSSTAYGSWPSVKSDRTFTITNYITCKQPTTPPAETGKLTVTKKWVDQSSGVSLSGGKVTVTVIANGEIVSQQQIAGNGSFTLEDVPTGSVTVTENTNPTPPSGYEWVQGSTTVDGKTGTSTTWNYDGEDKTIAIVNKAKVSAPTVPVPACYDYGTWNVEGAAIQITPSTQTVGSTVSVTGTIQTQDGTAIAGAKVQLRVNGSIVGAEMATDASGKVTWNNITNSTAGTVKYTLWVVSIPGSTDYKNFACDNASVVWNAAQANNAKITFEKYAKPWGGSYALANGWKLGVSSQTTGVTVNENGAQTTKSIGGKDGQTVWNVEYPANEKNAAFYLYEDDTPAGWSLASASCKQGATTLTMQASGGFYRVTDVDLSKGDVTCEFRNEEANTTPPVPSKTGWIEVHKQVPNGSGGWKDVTDYKVGMEQVAPIGQTTVVPKIGVSEGITEVHGDGTYKQYDIYSPTGASDKATVKLWEVGPTTSENTGLVFEQLECFYDGGTLVFPTYTSANGLDKAHAKEFQVGPKDKIKCYIRNVASPAELIEPAEVMLKKTITSKPGGEGTTRLAYNWWVKMDSADQSIATVKADNRPKTGGTWQPDALDADGFQKTYTVNKCANSADGKRGTCWTVDFQQDGMATFNFSEKMRTDSINDTGDPVDLAYVRGECKIARDGKTVTESFNVGNAAHPGKVGLQLQPGDKADCQLINSPTPYTAEVFVEKGYQDADGKWHTADSDLLEDWCVNVSTDVQGVTARPNGATGQGSCKVDGKDLGFQATAKGTFNAQTGANRTGASWTVELPSENSEVKLGISELQKPGWTYTQGNGYCWIKHEDGSSNNWWIDAKQGNAEYPSAMTITDDSDIGIKAGDKVRCRIMNIEPKATKVTLNKQATVDGKTTYPKWEVGLSQLEADKGAWTIDPAGAQTVNPNNASKPFDWNLQLPVGSDAVPGKKEVTLQLWEQNPVGADPLKFEGLTCTGQVAGSLKLPADGGMPTEANPATVKVKAGTSLNCTFKNKKEDPPAGANLTLEKKVVNPNGLLSSAYTLPGHWTLNGVVALYPGNPAGEWGTEIGTEKPTISGGTCSSKFGTCSSSKTNTWEVVPGGAYDFFEGAPEHESASMYKMGGWSCIGYKGGPDGPGMNLGGSPFYVPEDENYKDFTCTVTNSTAEVTLLKKVEGGDAEPEDFELAATGSYVDKKITGSAAASAAASSLVVPERAYTLSEKSVDGYELDRVEVYQVNPNCPALKEGDIPKDSANCWMTVVDGFDAEKGELSGVKLEGGEWRVYRFVNKNTFNPTGPTLPHAGGMSTTIFLVVAGISLTGAVIFGPFSKRRQGRHAQ